MRRVKQVIGGIKINTNIILYIILGIGLGISTITDLKYKQIYTIVAAADILLILGFHIWQKSLTVIDVAGAVVVFAVFMAVSILSEGQLGMGDAFLFAITGLGLGMINNIFIIMLSFIFAFAAAVFLVAVKHKSKEYSIPLAPFVLGSFFIYVAGGYIPL